jgi:phosphate transport system protein
MIRSACRALCERRTDLLAELMRYENRVNEREVAIEEACLKILALHQPVAVDLRRTATLLKINGDLERIADLAVNIAERTRSLCDRPEFVMTDTLPLMAAESISMVRSALDAFVDLDVDLARRVCAQDDLVDNFNRSVIAELQDVMRERPDLVEPALHFFSAARHVERIADHATNIAEDVIYLVEGEIARHRVDGPLFPPSPA